MSFSLDERHHQLLDAVNHATTEAEHERAMNYLRAWRDGVWLARGWDAARQGRMICDGDRYYFDGPDDDRPMCGGVWLDWTPAPLVTP